MKRFAVLLGLLISSGIFAGPAPAQDQKMIVFAAASLKDALDDVNAAYTKTKGAQVTASYAGSFQLIKQIEQGAPAEVFISADLEIDGIRVSEQGGAGTHPRSTCSATSWC